MSYINDNREQNARKSINISSLLLQKVGKKGFLSNFILELFYDFDKDYIFIALLTFAYPTGV